jgi:hypothetical protein
MLVSEDSEPSFRKRLRSPFYPNLEPWYNNRKYTSRVHSVQLNQTTEKVHGRARAPSRQTRRVAANEVRSRVVPRKGAGLFLFSQTGMSQRDVITYS